MLSALTRVAQTLEPVVDDPPDDGRALIAAFVTAVLAVGAFALWYHQRARGRLVRDLPTSRTVAVGAGLHEVNGTARSEHPDVCLYSGVRAVWWEHEVQVEDRDDNGRSKWRTVSRKAGGPALFEVDDGSGPVAVWPRRATVAAPVVYQGPEHTVDDAARAPWGLSSLSKVPQRRVIERALAHGEPVYVMATARIDPATGRPALGADPTGEAPFLIDAGGEAAAARRFRAGVQGAFLLTVLASAAAGWLFHQGPEVASEAVTVSESSMAGAVVGAALALTAMAAVSVAFAYNALVMLRNRAWSAWSSIDVELRRRHELIPSMTAVADAHRHHEGQLQTRLAELRAGDIADLPDRPTDRAVRATDQRVQQASRAVAGITALIEATPRLQADATFLALQQQLTETEDRIALSRTFYNDSVELLRDRSRTFPGSALARLFRLSLDAEFTAEGPATPESADALACRIADMATTRGAQP